MPAKKILQIVLIVFISIGIGSGLFIWQKGRKKPSPSDFPLLPGQIEVTRDSFLYLQTEKKNYKQGESFDLTVAIDAKKEIVDGAEFVLSYDPQVVEINEPAPGSFFALYPQKKVDPEKGIIRVMALQDFNENKRLDREIMVVLPVTALQKGIVNFKFNREKTHISAYGGQDLLKEAASIEIVID